MVVYAGQSPSNVLLQEPHLSGPLVDMARPIAKWSAQVEHAHDVPRALRRAFKIAAEPPQGPSFWRCRWTCWTPKPRWTSRRRPIRTGARGQTRPASRTVADLLVKARAADAHGRRLGRLADAQAEVARVAELLGAPMFECYASEFNVPAGHPLNLGSVDFVSPKNDPRDAGRLRRAVRRRRAGLPADLPRARGAGARPEDAAVQLDCFTHELGKNVRPGHRAAGRSEVGPGRAGRADPGAPDRARQAGGARSDARRPKRASRKPTSATGPHARENWDASPISGPRLMHEIKQALPDNGAGLLGRRDQRQARRDGDRARRARRGWSRCAAAASGRACPARSGAALARPDRKVVGMCSDGAAMYSITALWTAAHHRIPVTYVMLSNRAYRILKLNMLEYLGEGAGGREFVAMDLTEPELRFDRMAEAMGVPVAARRDARGPARGARGSRRPRGGRSWSTSCWRALYLAADAAAQAFHRRRPSRPRGRPRGVPA